MRFRNRCAVLLFVGLTVACAGDSGPAAPEGPKPVASVTVVAPSDSVLIGETLQFSAALKDATGGTLSNRSVTWSISDSTRASIDGSGRVSGKAAGTVTIHATSEGVTGSKLLTVRIVPLASLTLNAPADSVYVGDQLQLSATVRNARGELVSGRQITWTSSDPASASVDSTGTVIGVSAGTPRVTASVEGLTAHLDLSVRRVPLASITLSARDTSVHVGSALQVSAELRDIRGRIVSDRTVTWSSSDAARAVVSASGAVISMGSGPAAITATADGKSAQFTVGGYHPGFVTRLGRRFMLDGKVFPMTGANAQKSLANVDRSGTTSSYQNIAAMGGRVARIWAGSERGSADGSVRTVGESGSFRPYYQYWDPVGGKPVFNQGADGLQYLDNAIAVAGQNRLKLIFILVDNADWYWGGVNQYVTWSGGSTHGEFFRDARMKAAYKAWVSMLLNRVNTVTGVRYADDPTILAWELINEPSCYGGSAFPAGTCTGRDVEAWLQEMAAFVRSIDTKHMIGSGDFGHFANRPDPAMGWAYRSSNEPDFETVMKMKDLDYGAYHMYPHDTTPFLSDGSLSATEWGNRYIRDREAVARAVGKPTILEEFGARDPGLHPAIFETWLNTLYTEGGTGFTFYEIGAHYANGTEVWGSNGYNIQPNSPGGAVLAKWIRQFNERKD